MCMYILQEMCAFLCSWSAWTAGHSVGLLSHWSEKEKGNGETKSLLSRRSQESLGWRGT